MTTTRPGVSVAPPISAAQRSVLYAVRRRGEATVADVAEMLAMTPSGARQHLAALTDAGLLEAGDAARDAGPAGPVRALLPRRRGGRGPVPARVRRADQPAPRLPALGRRRPGVPAPARRPHRGRPSPARPAAQLRGQGPRAGQDPRRGRLPGGTRGAARRFVPHRRAQLRDLRRRPGAPAGVLDRARVPPRRPPRSRDRAGHPHDGGRPRLQLRDPPARAPDLSRAPW